MNEEAKGFFTALFDFSFSSFITTKLVKFVYIISLALAAIGLLAVIISGFMTGVMGGLLVLILSPVIALLEIMAIRMSLELVIVVFRIAENIDKLAKDKE